MNNAKTPSKPRLDEEEIGTHLAVRSDMKRGVISAIVLIWIAAIVFGLRILSNYDLNPGKMAKAPEYLQDVAGMKLKRDHPVLLVFAHPRCPCSRASISELTAIMTRAQSLVNAYVFILQPLDAPKDWYKTDLWKSASAIPGVVVVPDVDGRYARLFHAATSGQTILYSAKGKLVFEGGITQSRGHVGDNDGREEILSFLTTESLMQKRTPVFGCALFSDSSHCPREGKKCKE